TRALHSFPTRRSSDLFSAVDQWNHTYPWEPREGAADGTDRIMLGSSYTGELARDGYSQVWRADDDAAHTRPSSWSTTSPACRCRSEEHTSELQSRENL